VACDRLAKVPAGIATIAMEGAVADGATFRYLRQLYCLSAHRSLIIGVREKRAVKMDGTEAGCKSEAATAGA
jgi:hypothetical protein